MLEALDWSAVALDVLLYLSGIVTAVLTGKFKRK